jgi:hypothetical protein
MIYYFLFSEPLKEWSFKERRDNLERRLGKHSSAKLAVAGSFFAAPALLFWLSYFMWEGLGMSLGKYWFKFLTVTSEMGLFLVLIACPAVALFFGMFDYKKKNSHRAFSVAVIIISFALLFIIFFGILFPK